METVATIGLDIAKSVFQVHGVDAAGGVGLRQRLTRSRMFKFFGKLPSCLISMGTVPTDDGRRPLEFLRSHFSR
jgi:transposase